MGITWSFFFPPTPTLTESNLPSQVGRVFLVTGGTSGVGFQLCKMLYAAGGKVYVAARSEEKAQLSVQQIRSSVDTTSGQLLPFVVELHDLTTIKPAVENLLRSERRLDVLVNNAGVSHPPFQHNSAQGYDMTIAVNLLGPYLLTQLLLPLLEKTASLPDAMPSSTRVVFSSSITVDMGPDPSPRVDDTELLRPAGDSFAERQTKYAISKMANWFLAAGLQQQSSNILAVTVNPGNLKTSLVRNLPSLIQIATRPLMYAPKFGAYTNLFAGWSETLTISEHGGTYLLPWGRTHPAHRGSMLEALQDEEQGGTGVATQFVEFCNRHTRDFR